VDKYTLVPKCFFNGDAQLLSQVVEVSDSEVIKYLELPFYEAVLLFVPGPEGQYPHIYDLLKSINRIPGFNKVLFTIENSYLHLVLAAGDKLLLANSFEANDFTTALYYVFASMKDFQINPQLTTAYFKGELAYEQQEVLFSYFKAVESLCE